MVTQELVVRRILAHLNGELSEEELVHWAEDALVALSESAQDIPKEETLMDVLAYLAAGDSPGFPLSWSSLSGLLEELGVKVRVVAEVA